MPPGMAPVPWIFLPAVAWMISWPNLRSSTAWTARSLSSGGDADDVADGRVGVHAQEEVGRGEVEEVQGVGLEHLAVVHQAAHLLRRRGQLARPGADDDVHGLGRGQVVADRADAAEPLDEDGGLPVGAALDEALEAAELDDVETGLDDLAGVVQPDGDLAVALDAGDGFDRYFLTHGLSILQSNLIRS